MTEIRVPGQPQANPLLVLATALDKSNQHLAQIVINTKKEDKHLYALAELTDGSWGTYCLACSEVAEEYVYPCSKHDHTNVAPPSHVMSVQDIVSTDDVDEWPPERLIQDVPLPE